jgi:hypothetical protein
MTGRTIANIHKSMAKAIIPIVGSIKEKIGT